MSSFFWREIVWPTGPFWHFEPKHVCEKGQTVSPSHLSTKKWIHGFGSSRCVYFAKPSPRSLEWWNSLQIPWLRTMSFISCSTTSSEASVLASVGKLHEERDLKRVPQWYPEILGSFLKLKSSQNGILGSPKYWDTSIWILYRSSYISSSTVAWAPHFLIQAPLAKCFECTRCATSETDEPMQLNHTATESDERSNNFSRAIFGWKWLAEIESKSWECTGKVIFLNAKSFFVETHGAPCPSLSTEFAQAASQHQFNRRT